MTPKYEEGDMVWLDGHNIKTEQPTAKLAPRRHGPFPIKQVMSPVAYRLELPTQWNIHPVFHTDLLTPYHETALHGDNYQRPLPDLIDGEEEYKVEAILDSRRFGQAKRQQYLVKWKGYPHSDNQWLDKGDIFAEDVIREFKKRHLTNVTKVRILNLYLSRVLLLVGHMTDDISLSHMTLLIQVMTPFCSHMTRSPFSL